ncbi:MAG: hypothetical protein ACRDK3_18105 [Actinomycetota bacterium]
MRGRLLSLAALTALVFALAPVAPAAAEVEEPFVTTYSWYWENQTQKSVQDPTSGTDVATVGPGNVQFCPGAEGVANPQETCKPGRLPIEVVGGDYKTPDKISATAFDLSIAPMGSKVNEFTVTFLEASDEQSRPYNAEGKQLEACLIDKIFGGGEARQYKEAPKFTCPKKPILGKRTKIKAAKDGPPVDRFEWTFDLTAPAQQWVKEGSFATGIMIMPVEPKKAGPGDSNWRVVFQGSEDVKGVETRLDFIPAKLPDPLGGLGAGGGSGGDLGSSGGDLGSSGSLDTSSTDGGGDLGGATDVTGEAGEAAAPEQAEGDAELASDAIPAVPGGLPGYVWLALLAGLIGFSAVRSVVFESHSGVRPNGVLAQIHKLNQQRRGTSAPLPLSEGPLAALAGGLKSLGGRARAIATKLPLKRKA